MTILLALLACNGTPTPTPTEPANCGVEVSDVLPTDGATDQFIDADQAFDTVQVRADAELTLSLWTDGRDEPLPGDQELREGVIHWTPSNAELGRENTWTVRAETEDGCTFDVTTFTTGPWDSVDVTPLDGNVYALDLTHGEGEGAGMLANTLLAANTPITTGFRVSGTFEGDWTFVPLVNGTQNLCHPTTDVVNPGFLSDVLFMNGTTAPFGSDLFRLWWVQTDVYGLMTPDGSSIDRVRLRGQIDLNDMNIALGDDLCALATAFGSECEPCADGNGSACFPLDMTTRASLLPGVTATDVAPEDVQDCAF